jgi:hypothetical protein
VNNVFSDNCPDNEQKKKMNYESFPIERNCERSACDEDSDDDEFEKFDADSCWGKFCSLNFFGSDILAASWLFLFSSMCWGFMALDLLATETKVAKNVTIEQWCQIASAAIFTLGSIFLVEGAHPVYLAGPKGQTFAAARRIKRSTSSSSSSAPEDMSFTHRYFTGTDVLIAAWLFTVCAIPFMILGIYSIVIEPHDLFGYIYLIGSLLAFISMGIWVLGGNNVCI